MGYLYLFFALLAGLIKGYCGKSVSRDMTTFKECTFINLMRMLFCAVVGVLPLFFTGGIGAFAITQQGFLIYLMASISMSTFCVAWMYAYQNEAYMFLSVFTMLGSIVVCALDAIFYNVNIRLNQWFGMFILLLAVFIMSVYNKGIKGKLTAKGLAILIIGSLGSAVADFSQKVYMRETGQCAEAFNFYMYAFGFVLLLFVFLGSTKKKAPKTAPILYDKKHILVYFAMAFFLYLNSVTKTMAAGLLSTAQIYPVLQGANLIASTAMAHVFFKEKANTKCFLGIFVAFAGLMIMHLL